MSVPPHFLTRPPLDLDPGKVSAFERLFADSVACGGGKSLDYDLAAPKWQFLAYLCDHKELVLHGSGRSDIREFEPRQPADLTEFGNRRAVYAASDGIWPIYFAVMDRDGAVTSLVNACARLVGEDGRRSEPYYYFSINRDALPLRPFREGTIYILPRRTFERQPVVGPPHGTRWEVAQWASPVAVRPLALLSVGPEDFPFLDKLHGHDPTTLRERAARDPDGFPWLDD